MKKHIVGFSRSLSLILAALMLISLISCAESGDTPDDTSPQATEAGSEAATDDPEYRCDLPDDLNFGTEVNYLYTIAANRDDELVSEDYGLGVVSDSVYERNAAVSEKLGVDLAFTGRNSDIDTASAISGLVSAGDKSVDIFVIGTYSVLTPILAGHYLNLNGISNLDLSKLYWNQYYNEMMTFTSDNLQFAATSPTAISMFRDGYLTIFNRDKLAEYQIPDLYETVWNGDWTLEYQYGLIKDVYTDANGDGKRDIDDFFGFYVGNVTDMDVYAVSSDIHLAVRDENGDLLYNTDAFERLVDMGEKVSALCNAPGTYLVNSFNEGFDVPIEKFTQKKALMATTMFGLVERNIEYLADISYGIAPIPKLTKEQAHYGTYIQDQVSCFGISASIGDEDRQAVLGAVMEAMSYYSYVIVRPAYYDVALSLRFMQDPQSKAILDTMFESISFDYVYATSLGGVRDSMRSVISSTKPAIASQEKKWQKLVENALKSQQRSLDKLKNK
ncbi:MAG: hypothetical protein MJ192_11205 [Clostridia bacterium]|nr:hypothetical protein [Clostridia bacterium]